MREIRPALLQRLKQQHRLSICYVAPGQNLLPSAGPTRNILSLAEALSPSADVTVVFRRIVERVEPRGYKIEAIDPGAVHQPGIIVDDAALRGMSLSEFIAYLKSVRRFADRVHDYDVVLEKSWLLSGYLASRCYRQGTPAIVIENVVRVWNQRLQTPWDVLRYSRHCLAQTLVGHFLRRSPLIVAETEELKRALERRWYIRGDRIEVVPLGVNHDLFRPLGREDARRALGIPQHGPVLLYSGVLDESHDLAPILKALLKLADSPWELHIVGDGIMKSFYEKIIHAIPRKKIFFHGRVSHERVPQYIAAADLCLAPYNPNAFPDGQIGYSSLKIPEYMACGRPVASVPSGHILKLIENGISGFLFPNDLKDWVEFLRHCPSREQLKRMGEAAATKAASYSWQATALSYLSLCERVVRSKREKQDHLPLCALT